MIVLFGEAVATVPGTISVYQSILRDDGIISVIVIHFATPPPIFLTVIFQLIVSP